MAKSAGFLGKIHADKTREKIKVTQIVNRLNNHVLADDDIMTPSQVNAARILLAKAIPDLQAVQQDNTSSDGSMSPPTTIQLIGVKADDDSKTEDS
jgi:hypothetical protein